MRSSSSMPPSSTTSTCVPRHGEASSTTTATSSVTIVDDGERLVGEARVCTVGSKFAILSQPGLDGTIFVQSSSLQMASHEFTTLPSALHYNDVCEFSAVRQCERNGSKWSAVAGSVRVVRTAHMYEGEGIITKLDMTHGQFGFIHSSLGDVFFNASCVRPPTKHVAKALAVCQRVCFTAIDGTSAHHVQLRATAVYAMASTVALSYPPPSLVASNHRPLTHVDVDAHRSANATMPDWLQLLDAGRPTLASCLMNASPWSNDVVPMVAQTQHRSITPSPIGRPRRFETSFTSMPFVSPLEKMMCRATTVTQTNYATVTRRDARGQATSLLQFLSNLS